MKETIHSLCLRLHWLILSVQRSYLNRASAVSFFFRLEARNQVESFFVVARVFHQVKHIPCLCGSLSVCFRKEKSLPRHRVCNQDVTVHSHLEPDRDALVCTRES